MSSLYMNCSAPSNYVGAGPGIQILLLLNRPVSIYKFSLHHTKKKNKLQCETKGSIFNVEYTFSKITSLSNCLLGKSWWTILYIQTFTLGKIWLWHSSEGTVTGHSLTPATSKIFLFSIASRLQLRPSQPPIQVLSLGCTVARAWNWPFTYI
jgi:hypothetical protein